MARKVREAAAPPLTDEQYRFVIDQHLLGYSDKRIAAMLLDIDSLPVTESGIERAISKVISNYRYPYSQVGFTYKLVGMKSCLKRNRKETRWDRNMFKKLRLHKRTVEECSLVLNMPLAKVKQMITKYALPKQEETLGL